MPPKDHAHTQLRTGLNHRCPRVSKLEPSVEPGIFQSEFAPFNSLYIDMFETNFQDRDGSLDQY